MILVASQRRAPSKRLLAVCVGAFVWPFARVDSAMPSKRRRVAERLEIKSRIKISTAEHHDTAARIKPKKRVIDQPCHTSRTYAVSPPYGHANVLSEQTVG